jgi:hypothetical protein
MGSRALILTTILVSHHVPLAPVSLSLSEVFLRALLEYSQFFLHFSSILFLVY